MLRRTIGILRIKNAMLPQIVPCPSRQITAFQRHAGFCFAQRLLCEKCPFGWLCTKAS